MKESMLKDKDRVQIIKKIVYLILAMLIACSYIIVFFVFKYCDLTSITAWSYGLWDSVAHGSVLHIYEYWDQNMRHAIHQHCVGNYLWLVPVAVWNLPLWLLNGGAGNMALQPKAFLWTKAFFVLCVFLTMAALVKLIKEIYNLSTSVDCIEIALLFIASPELALSTVYAGQDEIVYILLFICGLYRLFSKKDWVGYIMFSVISITICPLMFLPFISIVLMSQKMVVRIIENAAFTVFPTILFELIYRNNGSYHENKQSFYEWTADLLTLQTVDIAGVTVSVLGVILIAGLVYCYYRIDFDYRTGNGLDEAIWMLALMMLVFCTLSGNHFYRFFIYVPFLLMLIFKSKKNKESILFFWFLLQVGRTIQCIFTDDAQVLNPFWRMDNRLSDKLIESLTRQGWYTRPNYNLNEDILAYIPGVEKIGGIVGAIIFVSGGVLLFMTYPQNDRKYNLSVPSFVSVLGCGLLFPIVILIYFALIGWWV